MKQRRIKREFIYKLISGSATGMILTTVVAMFNALMFFGLGKPIELYSFTFLVGFILGFITNNFSEENTYLI